MERSKVVGTVKKITWNLLIILILLIGVEIFQSRSLTDQLNVKITNQDLPLLNSTQKRSLLDQSKEYTLIYVFAPWCQVCELSAANMNQWIDSNLAPKALALSYGTSHEVAKFVRKTGLSIPIALGGEELAADLGIQAFPSYLLVNQEGKVLYSWVGYSSEWGTKIKVTFFSLVDRLT